MVDIIFYWCVDFLAKLAALFGTEIYNQDVWKKVYLIMSTFMFVGIFATMSSKEPKNRKNLKKDSHLKFLLALFFSVIGFIFLYSIIDNPYDKEEIFLSFIFSSGNVSPIVPVHPKIISFKEIFFGSS